MDHLETVPGSNSAEEGKFEYQVVFPELDNVRETNGRYMNQQEFKEKVSNDLDATNEGRQLVVECGLALEPIPYPYQRKCQFLFGCREQLSRTTSLHLQLPTSSRQ